MQSKIKNIIKIGIVTVSVILFVFIMCKNPQSESNDIIQTESTIIGSVSHNIKKSYIKKENMVTERIFTTLRTIEPQTKTTSDTTMTTTMLSVTEPQIETSVITEIETERTTQSIIYIEPVVSIIETPVVTTQVITIPVPVEVTNNGRLYNLTDSEIEAIAYITQAEAGSEIEAGKIAVVHCILNRVASSLYPNDVIGVISAPNQFSTYYNYLYRTSVPTEDTLIAVNKALEMYDSVNGATSFYAPRSCYSAWHESMQYCTTIGNHKFFKNW